MDLESQLLQRLGKDESIPDSTAFASELKIEHDKLVGLLLSLKSAEMIILKDTQISRFVLTDEAKQYVTKGSPEGQVFQAVPAEGVSLASIKSSMGQVGTMGFQAAMKQGWLGLDKSQGEPMIVKKVDQIEDKVQKNLQQVEESGQIADATAKDLSKRKLIKTEKWKTYSITKGPLFALQRVKQATDLTDAMLASGTWKTEQFKKYNFESMGVKPPGGHLHPLLKVKSQFKKIFLSMGFQEMPTNNYVESSFWNFDTLFQPQQHPARDAHDTFFLKNPEKSYQFPEAYLNRVRRVHESGEYGSTGYGSKWLLEEAQKNLLRTHTTAVSSRMLYKLAQDGFKPVKYFSIDRVFRNEAIDRTHLAEFHQVEGLICDRNLSLSHLMGTLKTFFTRLGMSDMRFKPAYNPYTEPSMEIFSYHQGLGKWVEVGNSGVFRPEMLMPMGLPEDTTVIAWGLSVERPTMILYGIDNIRDLFGHKVSLNMIRRNPICRMGF